MRARLLPQADFDGAGAARMVVLDVTVARDGAWASQMREVTRNEVIQIAKNSAGLAAAMHVRTRKEAPSAHSFLGYRDLHTLDAVTKMAAAASGGGGGGGSGGSGGGGGRAATPAIISWRHRSRRRPR